MTMRHKQANMIQVLAQGRLGNQMFQYAFGYAASKKIKTHFFMRGTMLWDFFELDTPKWLNVSKTTTRLALMRLTRPRARVEIDNLMSPQEVMARLTDGVVYAGYFQSEKFFGAERSEIEKRFTLLPRHKQKFLTHYGERFSQSRTVVVHVRRTDYGDFPLFGIQGSALLPFAYFRACLERIEELERYTIIFVSDEIETVAREFRDLKNAEFSSNEAIVDFQLLQHADIAILSNSSFSWWAAYLNQKNPLVFAPKDWLGFTGRIEYPTGVLLDRWEHVDVSECKPHLKIF